MEEHRSRRWYVFPFEGDYTPISANVMATFPTLVDCRERPREEYRDGIISTGGGRSGQLHGAILRGLGCRNRRQFPGGRRA